MLRRSVARSVKRLMRKLESRNSVPKSAAARHGADTRRFANRHRRWSDDPRFRRASSRHHKLGTSPSRELSLRAGHRWQLRVVRGPGHDIQQSGRPLGPPAGGSDRCHPGSADPDKLDASLFSESLSAAPEHLFCSAIISRRLDHGRTRRGECRYPLLRLIVTFQSVVMLGCLPDGSRRS